VAATGAALAGRRRVTVATLKAYPAGEASGTTS
jgi:hypothetical protein